MAAVAASIAAASTVFMAAGAGLQLAATKRSWHRVAGHSVRTADGRVYKVRAHYTRSSARLLVEGDAERISVSNMRSHTVRQLQVEFGPQVFSRPRRSAIGLTDTASLFLPAADRARYAEEYRSELWDLGQSGAGWLRQVLYAFRQIVRAIPMGVALRSPRRSAAP